MTTLYSCKSELDAEGIERYRITKFDGDMNVESSYIIAIGKSWAMMCDCPAGVRPSCRHRDMLPKFIARGAVNTMWMFDFDRSGWVAMDLEGDLNLAEQQASSNGPQIATMITLSNDASAEDVAMAFANIVGPMPNDLLNDIPMKEEGDLLPSMTQTVTHTMVYGRSGDIEAYGTSPAMIGLPMLQKENEQAMADLKDVEISRALSLDRDKVIEAFHEAGIAFEQQAKDDREFMKQLLSPSPSPLLRRF